MVLGGGIMNLTKHYYLATVVSRPNHGYATASARLSRGLATTAGLTHYFYLLNLPWCI